MSPIVVTVVMILTVWNTAKGVELEKITTTRTATAHPLMGPTAAVASAIEACRVQGVAKAKDLSRDWRSKGYAWASTNVDCEWSLGRGL